MSTWHEGKARAKYKAKEVTEKFVDGMNTAWRMVSNRARKVHLERIEQGERLQAMIEEHNQRVMNMPAREYVEGVEGFSDDDRHKGLDAYNSTGSGAERAQSSPGPEEVSQVDRSISVIDTPINIKVFTYSEGHMRFGFMEKVAGRFSNYALEKSRTKRLQKIADIIGDGMPRDSRPPPEDSEFIHVETGHSRKQHQSGAPGRGSGHSKPLGDGVSHDGRHADDTTAPPCRMSARESLMSQHQPPKVTSQEAPNVRKPVAATMFPLDAADVEGLAMCGGLSSPEQTAASAPNVNMSPLVPGSGPGRAAFHNRQRRSSLLEARTRTPGEGVVTGMMSDG